MAQGEPQQVGCTDPLHVHTPPPLPAPRPHARPGRHLPPRFVLHFAAALPPTHVPCSAPAGNSFLCRDSSTGGEGSQAGAGGSWQSKSAS